MRQLLIGGEALSRPHVRRALERLPETTLINGYGPTEATTFACCYRIPAMFRKDPDRSRSESRSPIPRLPPGSVRKAGADRGAGRDPHRRSGRRPGLLESAGSTAERFIPDRFGTIPGHGCTGRATSAGTCRTGTSSSWVGSMIR